MSRDALPQRAWHAARLRDAAIVAGFALPWLLALVAIAARATGPRGAGVVAVAAFAIAVGVLVFRWRRRDARWLVRTLDARRRDMEDSADLLLPDAARTDLQRLQRQRLQQRLDARPPDLRAAWPWRLLCASLLLAAVACAAAVLWPLRHAVPPLLGMPSPAASRGPIRVTGGSIDIAPPAYTRLPAHVVTTLSARAPRGATLRWRLRFSAPPSQAALVFLDGRRIALVRDGDAWQAALRLDASALYRLHADGRALDGPPHRLDALPDRAPQVKVVEPAQTLNRAAAGQRRWRLRFSASDDYGVLAGASLRITTARGSGENVAFQQRVLPVTGSGPATARRFTHELDLAALGLEPGDEVVARLTVRDNRAPRPQEAHGPSVILRLPTAQAVQASDLEASVRKVMPAYFRSQRQIIIDAEALLKQRRTLDADTFVKRSDAIGVDQRILRLRYGQFLGEEAEGGAKPPPTNDAPVDDAHADDDGHDQAEADAVAAPAFGNPGDVVSEYGHTHDHAEAATLLDPQTRATLRLALDQMWQSEGALRQGTPDRALPFAYKALAYIKQVQQAERIYLARVGDELPPIDETRRLTGKRDGLASRTVALPAASRDDAAVVALWRTLADAPGAASAPVDMQPLERWLRAHPDRTADPLAVHAAIDALRRDPACAGCRARLRALLWPLLATPPAAVERRAPTDPQGRRYLDALDAGAGR